MWRVTWKNLTMNVDANMRVEVAVDKYKYVAEGPRMEG
jgi:hypothetical protein